MIDTHSHLFAEEFADDLPQVIERAKAAGVRKVFMPNIDDTTIRELLEVCEAYKGFCYPMLGFHPTSVDGDYKARLMPMKKLLTEGHPYIAIGEVGMDLYWDKTYLKEQQAALDEQIHWALEYDLPLIIHCREAFPELFEVLSPYKNTNLSGIFHSFTGNAEEAEQLSDYPAFRIGINGVVTFKKSTLPETLKKDSSGRCRARPRAPTTRGRRASSGRSSRSSSTRGTGRGRRRGASCGPSTSTSCGIVTRRSRDRSDGRR